MPDRKLVALMIFSLLWGCLPSRGVYHTVQKGQTLYRISKTYEVNEKYLARINGISDPTRLVVGQRLFIPGSDRVRDVAPPGASSTAANPAPSPVARIPLSKNRSGSSSGSQKAFSAKNTDRNHDKPSKSKGIFAWPLKGKVLKGFSGKGTGLNRGLEISAPPGSSVRSAAAGRVIYSGNGIRSFGNLIILEHDDSYFTVYGFNEQNLVQVGTFVGKGERIALSGVPPGGGSPRLHFELRHGKKPIDPILYLP